MRRSIIATGALCLALAACGGTSPASSSSPSPAGASLIDTQRAIGAAAGFGCDGIQPNPAPETYATSEVSCVYRGQTLAVLAFSSAAAQAMWNRTAKAATQGNGTTVIAAGYVVECPTAAGARYLAKLVSATTR